MKSQSARKGPVPTGRRFVRRCLNLPEDIDSALRSLALSQDSSMSSTASRLLRRAMQREAA